MFHSASIGTRPSSQTVGTAQIMADSNSHSSNLEPPSCDPGQFTFSLLGERTQISEGLKGVTQLIVQKAIEHVYMCVWRGVCFITAGCCHHQTGTSSVSQQYAGSVEPMPSISQICSSPPSTAKPCFNLDKRHR